MRVAVDLDDQLRRRAHKIRDMPANHLLAPKLMTLQLPVRQTPPQALFRLGRVAAHLASALLHLFDGGGRQPPPRAPPPQGRGLVFLVRKSCRSARKWDGG